ncbi:hypothetical protein BDZ89DRAFT_527951 [Hymenopellis radicata]|nr:hypothetical protein BDZ89DRAFT_527951 [Hymenopellis radicata]
MVWRMSAYRAKGSTSVPLSPSLVKWNYKSESTPNCPLVMLIRLIRMNARFFFIRFLISRFSWHIAKLLNELCLVDRVGSSSLVRLTSRNCGLIVIWTYQHLETYTYLSLLCITMGPPLVTPGRVFCSPRVQDGLG